MTNQVILGEVGFYLLTHSEIEGLSLSPEKVLRAVYIGSDLTYAYCQKFRDTYFLQNTLDQ